MGEWPQLEGKNITICMGSSAKRNKTATRKIGSHFVKPRCHAFRCFQSGHHSLSLEKAQRTLSRSGSSEHSKFSRINSLQRPLPCAEVGSDAFFSSSSITLFVCPVACSIMVISYSELSIWSRTAWTMGTIIAVVAVLLIHMDRKAVTTINPSMRLKREKQRRKQEKKTDFSRHCSHRDVCSVQ